VQLSAADLRNECLDLTSFEALCWRLSLCALLIVLAILNRNLNLKNNKMSGNLPTALSLLTSLLYV
jgi:hypothetical protein